MLRAPVARVRAQLGGVTWAWGCLSALPPFPWQCLPPVGGLTCHPGHGAPGGRGCIEEGVGGAGALSLSPACSQRGGRRASLPPRGIQGKGGCRWCRGQRGRMSGARSTCGICPTGLPSAGHGALGVHGPDGRWLRREDERFSGDLARSPGGFASQDARAGQGVVVPREASPGGPGGEQRGEKTRSRLDSEFRHALPPLAGVTYFWPPPASLAVPCCVPLGFPRGAGSPVAPARQGG